MKSLIINIILLICIVFSEFSSVQAALGFNDISPTDPDIDSYSFVQAHGIMTGNQGNFYPGLSLTRCELMKVALLASHASVVSSSTTTFSDIPTTHWCNSYATTARAQGIVSGYPDGTFRPNQKVSQIEALKILINSARVTLPTVSSQLYLDVQVGDWWAPYIQYAQNTLYQSNPIYIRRSSSYGIHTEMLRSETAYLVWKLFNHSTVVSPTETTSDNLETLSRSSATARSSVVILVDENLSNNRITNGFTTWINNLVNEGYNVQVKINNWTNVEGIRGYLQNQYASLTPRLEGAILVGNIPYANILVSSCNVVDGCTEQSAISYELYQDLDGVFVKSNTSSHELYTEHTGNVDHEIWISALPMYGDYSTTQEAIIDYLHKNHVYRTHGQTNGNLLQIQHLLHADTLPEAQDIINGLMRGIYAIAPDNQRFAAQFYAFPNSYGFITPEDGYHQLSGDTTYDFFELDDHADYNQIGMINKSWLDTHTFNAAFAFFTGCNTAKLDAPNPSIAVHSLYHRNSKAVLLLGTTINSGGLGQTDEGIFTKVILKKLFSGYNIGRSFQYHFNLPLLSPWDNNYELHHAPVFLGGDGTLKLKI